jgi:hypothetical protein
MAKAADCWTYGSAAAAAAAAAPSSNPQLLSVAYSQALSVTLLAVYTMQLLTSAFGGGRLLLLLALLQQLHTLQPGLDDIKGMQEQDGCATSDSSSQHVLPAHGTGSAGVLSYCCSRGSAVPAPSSLSLAILLRHVV